MKKINKLLAVLVGGFIALTSFGGEAPTKKVSASESSTAEQYTLSQEIAKMNSWQALNENLFSFYTAVYWCGPYVQWNFADLHNSIDAGVASYSRIEYNSTGYLIPGGAPDGLNTVFSYTGSHSVGKAEASPENVADGVGHTLDRTWAIGWTAPENGTVTIPQTTLAITGSLNADLSMGFSKGASTRPFIVPTDANLGWATYQSANMQTKTYTIPEQTFKVAKGEVVYINLYALAKEGVSDAAERYVQFNYDPTVVFEPALDTLHSYNHMQKLSLDNKGALENNVRITLDDETTYPFSYLYRLTAGSDYGIAGQEAALAVAEMVKATKNIDPTGLRLYAPETYSGFLENGVIVNVANSPDPMNVILGFTVPYSGELSISDLAFTYGTYPHKGNGYTNINGTPVGSAYKGLAFRILLNGKQVWPVNSDWDRSLAKLHTTESEEYAVGDLIPAQSMGDIAGIKVKKYDEIYFELTRADLNSSEDCDTISFNPTFTIDETADMSDYVYYVTASDYFDITSMNSSDAVLSYWGIDVTDGLYKKAKYKLMNEIDFASLTYTTSILEDNASDVGWNYFRPKYGEDAAIAYTAPYGGNLTISAETIFRGGNMALWEAFDLINKGSLIETDGVRMRIEINGQRAWPVDKAWEEYKPRGANDINGKGVFNFDPITFGVLAGDVVTIRINCGEKHIYDGFNFNPIFALDETNQMVSNPTITVADPADVAIKTESDSDASKPSQSTDKKGCGSAINANSLFAFFAMAMSAVVIKKRK